MAIRVRFMTCEGKFATSHEDEYETADEAFMAVQNHAAKFRYTDVKVKDNDGDGIRYTARTPGGRPGRNIAFGDWTN